jgi:hypothetical protein
VQELFHRPAATAAADGCGGFECGLFQRANQQRPPGVEGDALAFEFGRWVAEPEVADRAQAARQDVAQVSADKLNAGEGFGLLLVTIGAVLPAEGDVTLSDGHNARVADGGARDIAAKVADDIFTRTKGL